MWETIERSMIALHILTADAKYNSMSVTRTAIHITTFFDRGIYERLPKVAYERTDRECLWIAGAGLGTPRCCDRKVVLLPRNGLKID